MDDRGNGKGPLTSVEDIMDFDRRMWEVTADLRIRLGSLLRVGEEHLAAWGIKMTDENRDELSETAEEYRRLDYEDRRNNPSIESIQRTERSEMLRTRMARLISFNIKEYLVAIDDGHRTFDICILPSGTDLPSAIATSLRSDADKPGLVDRVTFHLVDQSLSQLDNARRELRRYRPGRIVAHSMHDDTFLGTTDERFDAVASICHLHKKTRKDIFAAFADIVKEGGVFISGDWHSSLSANPRFVFQLLERLGLEDRRLNLYRNLLGDKLNPHTYPTLTEDELAAVADHQQHWIEVNSRLMQMKGRQPRRMFILGAYDSTRQRERKLKNVGFVLDSADIQRAFPRSKLRTATKRLVRNSDSASVIFAMKRGR